MCEKTRRRRLAAALLVMSLAAGGLLPAYADEAAGAAPAETEAGSFDASGTEALIAARSEENADAEAAETGAEAAGSFEGENPGTALSAEDKASDDAPHPDSSGGNLLHTERFSASHELKGLFAEGTEYFSAGDWDILSAELSLLYSVTQMQDEALSSFTVYLNGEPFYSGVPECGSCEETDSADGASDAAALRETSDDAGCSFSASDAGPSAYEGLTELRLSLPKRLIREGINTLRIESYIRTANGEPCADDAAGANWMVLSKDSSIRISYRAKEPADSIAALYEKLSSIEALENGQAAVILADDPSDEALTAAAYILSGLSQNAGADREGIRLLSGGEAALTEAENGVRYAVFAAAFEKLPQSIVSQLSGEERQAAETGALLKSLRLSGKYVLLLTGADEALVTKGGTMFANPVYMKQLTDGSHAVSEAENVRMEESEVSAYQKLTEDGAYADGAFRQSLSFTVPSAANKTLSPKSELYLSFRYAENLDFDRSLLTVYVNDTPIGSHKLSKARADGDEAHFYLPADLAVSGDFQVRLSFDLELKDLWCTLRREEMPWAYVSPESGMKLVTADAAPLLFDYYPAPFIRNGSFNEVLIALPKDPKETELSVFKELCVLFGQYLKNNAGSVTVSTAPAESELAAKNLVLIGTPQRNPLIAENNDAMYFRFSEDGTALLGNEKQMIAAEQAGLYGTGQLLLSPYASDGKAMLLVTGASDTGVAASGAALSDAGELWRIAGDGFLADTAGNISAYRFKKDGGDPAEKVSGVFGREDVTKFLLAALCGALILIVSLFFLLTKYLRKEKETGAPDAKRLGMRPSVPPSETKTEKAAPGEPAHGKRASVKTAKNSGAAGSAQCADGRKGGARHEGK